MSTAEKITVETSVKAPVAKVWQAYTTPADIMKWNTAQEDWHTTAATVDLREGGKFSSRMEAKDKSFGFDFAGTYTKVITNKLIAYEFGGRHAEITFSEHGKETQVQVVFDAETENPVEMQRGGWQAILNSFKKHVEAKA